MTALVIALGAACKPSGQNGTGNGGNGGGAGGRGGGTVACTDDGTRNKAKGQACCAAAQCSSGFCADGFCCDTACSGTCMTCGLATSLGTCTATPAGVAPRTASQCVAQDKSTCGLDGTCDGTGKCRSHVSGTTCSAGTCDSGAVIGINTCDGAGRCKLSASTVCAPYLCNAATNACFSTCSSDANCVAGRKCVNGMCGPKMNGSACGVGAECASGFCADGVCCNTSCGGACRSCNQVGLVGTCSPVPAGQGHAMCAMQAASTCGTAGVCDGFGACSMYPQNSPCGASTCVGPTSMNTARSCDGLGVCQASEVRDCGTYKCANGACNSRCTGNADCADGIACVNNSCGPKVNGQPCAANADCQSNFCVADTTGGQGICCNNACTGACRSCATGSCILTPNGNADPRATCVDMMASSCGTDGRCNGAGACRRYTVGTVCAAETCVADVYTGQSTCNASGQCIRPNALPCAPYKCNVTKCFTACTASNAECVPPNICGMAGMISSCGLKPNGATCSATNECASGFCAQGVCCNSACNTACHSCGLAGSVGSCSNVASGPDPQTMCAVQATSTCGTTGQCAAGQCARHASGVQCVVASCPSASTNTPASTCNGTGMCVTPSTTSCAPGRCVAATTTVAAQCVNTCATNADCTAPATCVNGSCGQQPMGGPCTGNNNCATGLTCYLAEGSGVCCNTACSGTCESCKVTGSVGTCTAIAAGVADPDLASLCVAAADPMTCGLNGRCAGNNTATNGAGTARCQFFGATGQPAQGCRSRSCTPGNATTAATETAAADCNGAGACPAVATTSCTPYNKCINSNTQCATGSCGSDADCVGVTCNMTNGLCGSKFGPGATCTIDTDCTSGNCEDGVCCNVACTGACQACNLAGSVGTCTNVTGAPPPSPHPGCATQAPCGNTGVCAAGVCATSTAMCSTTMCSGSTITAATSCSGAATSCPPGTPTACPGLLKCANATSCLTSCMADADCVGVTCNMTNGQCGSKFSNGTTCTVGTDCTSGNCVDNVCCNGTCAGGCQSCNQTGMLGMCLDVTTGGPDSLCYSMSLPMGTCNPGLCTTGGCSRPGVGTTCGAAVCSSGSLTPARTCDGAGSCSPAGSASPCAGGFVCQDATSCRTGPCTMDSHCTSGRCDTATGMCGSWTQGHSCTTSGQCTSGNCVDGYCCNDSCAGLCKACGISGSEGTCTNITGSSASDCPANGTCGNTGSCSGGACVQASTSVICGLAESCVDGAAPADSMHTPISHCSGTGSCTQESAVACPGHLLCNGNTCHMTCTMATSPECVVGFTCPSDGALACTM